MQAFSKLHFQGILELKHIKEYNKLNYSILKNKTLVVLLDAPKTYETSDSYQSSVPQYKFLPQHSKHTI